MLKLLAGVVVAVMLSGAAVAGPFEDGLVAYERGDYATALQQWRPLAEQGNADAQRKLGIIYDDGLGVPEDDSEAMRWYRLAAERGDQFAEGMLLFLGDYSVSLKNWKPLAKGGDPFFQTHVGEAYSKGVPRDYVEAVKWYRLAADQGYADAQNALGLMYGDGVGVPQDFVLAHMWFNLAAAKGNVDAAGNRDKVAKLMTPDQIAEAQRLAREWKPTPER